MVTLIVATMPSRNLQPQASILVVFLTVLSSLVTLAPILLLSRLSLELPLGLPLPLLTLLLVASRQSSLVFEMKILTTRPQMPNYKAALTAYSTYLISHTTFMLFTMFLGASATISSKNSAQRSTPPGPTFVISQKRSLPWTIRTGSPSARNERTTHISSTGAANLGWR